MSFAEAALELFLGTVLGSKELRLADGGEKVNLLFSKTVKKEAADGAAQLALPRELVSIVW